MSDTAGQPTRKSDPQSPTPYEGETHDAPLAPEPGTLSARTHTHDSDPRTASLPLVGSTESFTEPPGFVILRELGSGGMGIVYEARQTKLNRLVALKVLKSGRDTQSIIRFLKEGEAVAEIKHPNVVQVFEVGQSADGPFMALELLTGGTLSDRLRTSGRYDPRGAAELLVKLAAAIQAAHDLGIVHRDMKPGNVLFDATGEPKITDFGLAKKTGGADLTRTQALMGTPAYMAPEQARGEARFVGPPADVWRLGAILYECLTGKRAFEADDTWAVLRKVTDEAPLAPRTHVSGLPRDLELIALKCLEKSPADRYPSAAALAADLENYLAGRPVSVRPAGPLERLTKWVKRNPVIAGATVAVFLALVVGSAVSLAFGIQAAHRGDDLAKANDDLSRTNDNLIASQKQLADTNANLLVVGTKLQCTVLELTLSEDDLRDAVKETKRQAAESEQRGYLSDIALAHQLWKANDLRGMRAALERCPPNRRKWEWHYLDRISRPEREIIATDAVPLALAYSPDGKLLAHVSMFGALVVRDLATGKDRIRVPGTRNSPFAAVVFRPTGGELIFTDGARVVAVDLENEKVRELLPKNPNRRKCVAVGYSPDGRVLVAVERQQNMKPWTFEIIDAGTGKTLATLEGPIVGSGRQAIGQLAGAAFSPDGTHFAAAIADSGVRVRSAGEVPAKEEPIRPVLVVWNIEQKKVVTQTDASGGLLSSIAFSPDSKSVGFGRGTQAGEIGTQVGASPRLHGGHTGQVTAMAFDRAGRLWSGGENRLVIGHDRISGMQRFALRGCPDAILRIAVSPDGKEVAAAVGSLNGGTGGIYRFDISASTADSWYSPSGRRIGLVTAMSPTGDRVAACDFEIDDLRPESVGFVVREPLRGIARAIKPADRWFWGAFRPNGELVVVDNDSRIRVLDAAGKIGPAFPMPEGLKQIQRFALTCTPDGKTLVGFVGFNTEKRDKLLTIRLVTWDADTGKLGVSSDVALADTLPQNWDLAMALPGGVAVDPNGKQAAVALTTLWTEDKTGKIQTFGVVLVLDLASGKEVFRKVTAVPLRAVGFHEGRIVAAGGTPSGGVILGWDRATGAESLSIQGHSGPVLTFAFGPNGRLATGGADRVVKLWDVASGREVLTFDGFARDVSHLTFTPDGKNLVAGTGLDWVAMLIKSDGLPTDWPPAEVRVFRGPK